MGRALARGWKVPVVCCDVIPELAEQLAEETGGEAVATPAAVAEKVDVVFLCHKPYQLKQVAAEIGGKAKAVASILAGVPISDLESAYPNTPVIRLMPNTAVETGRGVICIAPVKGVEEDWLKELVELLERCGGLHAVEERHMDVAMALISVAPAYIALIAEAWADAGIGHGMPAADAVALVSEAIAGSADLLIANDHDTLKTRRAVTTPGGVTAQGLAALERHGIRPAFREATDDVLGHLK
jgi:pyrroline-5-carboxylate reductase